MFDHARRTLICLLLIPALLVKSAALGCPHAHDHELPGHATLVHFHWGNHCHHHGQHHHDSHTCGLHSHGPSHFHSEPGSESSPTQPDSESPQAPGHHDSCDPESGEQRRMDRDGVTTDCVHDCSLIVLGVKIDLQSQTTPPIRFASADGPDSLRAIGNWLNSPWWSELTIDCRPAMGGPNPHRCAARLYRCAPAPLFLQLLCLRI